MTAFHLRKGAGSDDSDMKQQSRLAIATWGFWLLGHERSKLYIKIMFLVERYCSHSYGASFGTSKTLPLAYKSEISKTYIY